MTVHTCTKSPKCPKTGDSVVGAEEGGKAVWWLG